MVAQAVDLDALVEAAEFAGLAGSVPTVWLVAQNPRLAAVTGSSTTEGAEAPARRRKALPWSPAEDQYLRANLGYLSEDDMARELGRTVTAVHLHWKRELRLPPPRKSPGWTTPNRVARSLAIDGHCVMRLIRDGILPAEPLPWLNQGLYNTYRLRTVTFYRWALNPRHWIYFRTERVRDRRLRRLLELKTARWGDAWLTPGQVAAMHGVDHRDVNRFIHAGKLPAVRWNNWRILRSDAVSVHFPKGRGAGHESDCSPATAAFMLLARAVGLSNNAIGTLTGQSSQLVSYRLHKLCVAPDATDGGAAALAQAHGLTVQIGADGRLFADWRQHRRRFPAVAAAMARFAALVDGGETGAAPDLNIVRGVLWSWATWHATTDEQRRFAQNLTYASNATRRHLSGALSELRSWGVEPLQ